jgi:SAM-dependent methyltransferase
VTAVNEPPGANHTVPDDDSGDAAQYHKKDFWAEENLKYEKPHFRLEKAARIINRMAGTGERDLLDVGCGPATLMHLLSPNVHYHGIDIAIQHPAAFLVETDFVENPIDFDGRQFDLVLAQGVFEYMGTAQSRKLAEIAGLLKGDGRFVVSYVNFAHHKKLLYWPYNNIQPIEEFRASVAQHFRVDRVFPTSHNWNHSEPGRRLMKATQMHINVSIPLVSPRLAVEYFLICSPRGSR